ncbi:MAG: tetratricopeptide repeat protein [Stenomitos rutilans HA7619-LM2]|jgi:tetratricopeptide (TPR) repeat protein|nr:tetratricopeptide repeat protein [Stenomitos rutilans HA7619-LM2]
MVAISEVMATALQAYRVGNLVQAEWLCNQVLEQQQTYVPALHLLGAIAQQTGRLESAIAHYERAITLDPRHAEAHGNLAVAFQERGEWENAATHFQRSLALNPNHAPTHFNAGNLALTQKRLDEAILHYQHAIALNPNYARAYTNLGNAFRAQGQLEAAIVQYQQVLTLVPTDAQAYTNFGNALQAQGQPEAAIAYYQSALALQPTNAEVYFNLGNAFRLMMQAENAIAHYQQALTLKPYWAAVHSNLALCLQEEQHYEAAIAHFQQAVDLEPTDAEAHNNLGVMLYEMNELARAIAHCQQAIDLQPEFAEAHLNLSMALLANGDYHQGFREYEWRWQAQDAKQPSLPGSRWDGSALEGRTLLLYTEQGLGDAIQFIRYVPLLARQHRVLVECPNPLLRLFGMIPNVELIPQGSSLPAFDVHLPLMSLPYILGTTLETIPHQVPYLSVPADCKWSIADRTHSLETSTESSSERATGKRVDPPLRLGIVWASGLPKDPRQRRFSRNRTAPLTAFMNRLRPLKVELYSLQVGVHAADIARYGFQTCLHDLSSQLRDFGDTAAAIDQLDLIISVDTAVAHLAGALAKPVWIVLPFAGDWRWLLHRKDSPWYPTMRLFRQPSPGDWEGVMAEVVQALEERLDHEHSS